MQMYFHLVLLLLLSYLASAEFPNPIPFTGPAAENPPASPFYQDITIIRRNHDGIYFRFSKSNDTGLGLSVATAPAFRGPWTYSYAALSGTLKDPAAVNRSGIHLWAPEVHFFNGVYYLYYGINAPDHGHGVFDIAVATSLVLEAGSWVDHGSVGIPAAPDTEKPEREYVRLGVNLLANSSDPSGVDTDYHHLTLGSFNHGLYGISLVPDLLTVVPNTRATEVISDQYTPGKKVKAQGNKTEGSYQLHHGLYIYQFYSIGVCCSLPATEVLESVYRVEVCRGMYADGPNGPFFDRDGNNCVSGPYNRTGTVVLSSHGGRDDNEVFAPGSIGILRDEVEGLVMYYQYRNLTSTNHSLRFGYNYLGFGSDDWPVLLSERSAT